MTEPWEFFRTIEDLEELYSGPMGELKKDEGKVQDALVLAISGFIANAYNDIEQASDRESAERFQLELLERVPISPGLKMRLSEWVTTTCDNLVRKKWRE